MSFNRGLKRDSFGNRNFNNRGPNVNTGGRTGGGMGGGGMGGASNTNSSGMNPWEGGMMPGRGILPTPNSNLNLASPQAQLAIASNLLTNLLRSQQDVQPQVPSLLSLGNNYGGPGPNYSGQQNYSSGRFNDRSPRHPLKNQRPQPYNKMGNRARDGPAGRRGQSAQQSRAPQSGNQRMNGNQVQHRNDKSSKPTPASKQNQTAKKEQQDVKPSDSEKTEAAVEKSDEVEELENKKRDWQDEKKVEAQPSNPTDTETVEIKQEEEQKEEKPAVEEATKETSSTTEKDAKATGKKSEARHAESRYAEVPISHMFCHICNKHMWDGYSFENHLRGRAHQLMIEKLDESYKLKVDLMRHELRVAEEQRELCLTNLKRRGKKVPIDISVREYCTMCDLHFYGTLLTHRKSEKHQQLKTFLHPRCFPCVKEFPSRIEYDEHCLTPGHMKNTVQCEEQRKIKKKEKLAKGEAEVRTAEDEEKDVGPETKEKEEELTEQEYITDITENMNSEKKLKIPSYKYCRQNQILIGKSLIKEVQGFYCEKCRRFTLLAEDMNAHLRSVTHYRNFIQEVRTLTSTSEQTEVKSSDAAEANEKNFSQNNEEYEGNWKRRKVVRSEDEDYDETKEEQQNVETTKKNDGEEKYDPLEADEESEEDENAKNNENVETNSQVTPPTEEVEPQADKKCNEGENENNEQQEEKEVEKEVNEAETPAPKVEQVSPQIKTTPPPLSQTRGFNRGGRGGPRARRSRR